MGGLEFASIAAQSAERLSIISIRIWRASINWSISLESLYLLIPISLVLVFVIAGLFWWSVRSGQFDDLEGPAHRILMDGERKLPKSGKQVEVPDQRMPD